MNGIRKISEDFLSSLKSGELSKLTELVKTRDDLIMCFRDGYINVYYKSHSVFKITEQQKIELFNQMKPRLMELSSEQIVALKNKFFQNKRR